MTVTELTHNKPYQCMCSAQRQIFVIVRSVIKRPKDSTTSTTNGQTNGETSTTSGQTSTTSG